MRKREETGKILIKIYSRLLGQFGKRNWWPAETPFEVMVGAILAQNTNWKNVSKAIENLKKRNLLQPERLAELTSEEIESLIKPSGYYRQKAKKLKSFLYYFLKPPINGSVLKMRKIPKDKLRKELLSIYGIGPETADSILLYALGKRVFVIDAYTRRIFARLGLTPPDASYDELKEFFETHLPKRISIYNDFHAQIVALGNKYCRKKPRCNGCPLQDFEHYDRNLY